MNPYYDDIEEEPLSLENPIDWYYDGTDYSGFATQCVVSIFRDFVTQNIISIKLWSLTFDGNIPLITSEHLKFKLLESNIEDEYAHVRIQTDMDSPEKCQSCIHFHPDFYFCFMRIENNGKLTELDYYDDYCNK